MSKEITIKVTAPKECTNEEFNEWVYFCLGYIGNISLNNPLCDYDLEADSVDIN